MIKLYSTILVLCNLCFVSNSKIRDGKYKVVYDESYKDYKNLAYINFRGGKCVGTQATDIIFDGQVIKEDDDTYTIKYQNRRPAGDTSDFERLILKSFGRPFIKIWKVKSDSLFFETKYSGNLHITINSGVMVKVK